MKSNGNSQGGNPFRSIRYRLYDVDQVLTETAGTLSHTGKLAESNLLLLNGIAALDKAVHGEMDSISQALTRRVKELGGRYETPMPQMIGQLAELESKVSRHLDRMGFAWS